MELVTLYEPLFQTLEKRVLCHTSHSNDAAKCPGWQGLGSMNRDRYTSRVSLLYHHVVAAFDAIQTKSQFFQRSDHIPAADGREIRHLANSDETL